jgi:predicted flap endonuclease-1-like 5' DNA nuclease
MEMIFNMVFGLMAVAAITCLVCNYFYFKKQEQPKSDEFEIDITPQKSEESVVTQSTEEKPSNLIDAPREGEKDDLKKINGIGPKLEQSLNSLGVYHFDQIAEWSDEQLDWIDDYLSFKGRAKRDDWISQAKELSQK